MSGQIGDDLMIAVPVVVVTTNAAEHLPKWLASVAELRASARSAWPVPCIVDNGSSDRTPGLIWEAIRNGSVEERNVFWLHKNNWFVSAQNYAFRKLGSRGEYPYVATLNEDATADRDWLNLLCDAALKAHTCIGMFGGPILIPEGTTLSSAGHALRGRDGAFLDIDRGVKVETVTRESTKNGYEPFSPCFAASLWSFDTLACVGLPDNEQLIYYDDVELAYKGRIAGWACQFVPNAKAYHPLPGSASDPTRLAAQLRGRLAIVRRYFPEAERRRVDHDELVRNKSSWAVWPPAEPFGDEPTRQCLFSKWNNVHVPINRQ